MGKLQYVVLLFLLTILLPPVVRPAEIKMARVIQISGNAENSSIATGKRFNLKNGYIIETGSKIRTGLRSKVEVLLFDGTSIMIREMSSISFYSLRAKKTDPPTKLKVDYGKITVTPKKTFNDRTMILTTPTAIISIVNAKFSIIVSNYETKALAYNSRVGVANINPSIKQAYVFRSGEEVCIWQDEPPTYPVKVPSRIFNLWFDFYDITDNHTIIVRRNREEGIIDWLIRKREY